MKIRLDRGSTAIVRRAIEKRGKRAVKKAVQSLVEHCAVEIVAGVEGQRAEVPERVDTHRYADGWIIAGRLGSRGKIGNIQRIRERNGRFSQRRSDDGSMAEEGQGLRYKITVFNNVPYGDHIEHGTRRMRAGGHLKRALALTRQEGPRIIHDTMLPLLKED